MHDWMRPSASYGVLSVPAPRQQTAPGTGPAAASGPQHTQPPDRLRNAEGEAVVHGGTRDGPWAGTGLRTKAYFCKPQLRWREGKQFIELQVTTRCQLCASSDNLVTTTTPETDIQVDNIGNTFVEGNICVTSAAVSICKEE